MTRRALPINWCFSKDKSTNNFLLTRLDTLFVGQVHYDLPSVPSTSEHALSLLSKSKPSEGTVISTRNQTAGRGQIGSTWESEPGKNITLSIIFYPTFLPATGQFLLSQAISLGVAELLSDYLSDELKIKWPNDIYAGDKKIAGILIQNAIAGNYLRSSVVGIGINVNQVIFLSDAPNPTSLKLETGVDFDLDEIITALFKAVEAIYLKLKSGKIVHLRENYLQRLYLYRVETLFERADGFSFIGIIEGVTETGRLIVRSGSSEETFEAKEIRLIV